MTSPTAAERAARLHAAALAANDDGQPARAARQLRAGLRLVERAPAAPDVTRLHGRLLMSLAWAESERGHVDLGFRLLDEAEAVIPHQLRPILLAQRALLLKRSGRNEQALRWYDEAIALLADGSQPLDLVKALNNRSLVHLEAGNVRRARADLLRCDQIAERHGLALFATSARTNLGCLDVIAGDLPSALRAFARSGREYEALAPGLLATLSVERARALLAAGLFTEADRELAAAIDQAVQQRQDHIRADALQVRAEAALISGRPTHAAEWARQARARFHGRDNARREALASLIELRADHARATGADLAAIADRAGALVTRLTPLGLREDARVAGLVAARSLAAAGRRRPAERIVARLGRPGRVDRLDTRLLWRLTKAELAAAAGRPDQASRHLLAGMAAVHRHRARFGCLDLQTGAAVHGRDLARCGLEAALASGSPAAVYRWSERGRAQALLLPPVRPPADPEAAAALAELRQVRQSLREAELAGRPAGGLRTRVERLQRQIRERAWAEPGTASSAEPALAPLGAVKDELAGAALVVYLRDGDTLRALLVVDGSASLVPVGEYRAAEEATLRLRADLDTRAGRAMPARLAEAVAAATHRDADRLSEAVLGPLLPRLGDRDLVVVPTSGLITTPWSALPACAGRAVTVAHSATTWLTARGRAGATDPSAGALLVAGPGIDRGDAEVQAITGLHPRARALIGATATPESTLAAISGVPIAHLAAHGQHEAENALFSTLELAGGPLFGHDLQRVAEPPRMVVLSACDLGLTDVRPGDETLGMVTALLSTGSATVIASVSRVADEAAMTTMVGYHRAIAAGHRPAAALAGAVPRDRSSGFVCFGAG